MFHMMSCFNLQPGITIEAFSKNMDVLFSHLKAEGLVERMGPIGRRQDDTPMDTDEERNHQYFFILSFRDREQCDRSYDYILARLQPGKSRHDEVYTKVENPVFICFEDIEGLVNSSGS